MAVKYQYLLGLLKYLAEQKQELTTPPANFMYIAVLGLISLFICEGLFAYFIFEELGNRYFSKSVAALILAGFFFLQALSLLLYARSILCSTSKAVFFTEGYENVKKVVRAFIDGFTK